MGAVRDFEFRMPIDRQAYKPTNAKLGQTGSGLRYVTYFYNFGTPFISLEQTKIESINLVCRLIVRAANQKMQK